MSDHTEWGKLWRIVKWAHGNHETWPRFTFKGEDTFDIHHARHFLSTLDAAEGWQILHAHGWYPPEEWVGVPSHHVNRNTARAEKPAHWKLLHPDVPIPPDHDYGDDDA